jgi:hypothetical protein
MWTLHSNGALADRTASPEPAQGAKCAWEPQLTEARSIKRLAMARVRHEERQATQLDRLATLLGTLATFLAAAAAMNAAGGYGSGLITASCAVASALTSGLTVRFHPAKAAHHLRVEAIRWYDLIDDAKRFDRHVRHNAGRLAWRKVEHRLHALQTERDRALRAAVAGENAWLSHARHRRRTP